MKQNLKERVNGKNGITLIALVITIIVLLILAGVTIATLTGDNGILTKAQNAKTQNDKATVKEKVDLAIAASLDETGKINLEQLKTNLNNVDGINPKEGDLTDSSFPLEVTVDGTKVTIKKDSNGKYSTSVGESTGSSGGGNNGISKTESYIGYYADIDDDGTIDGVIYADLVKGENVEKKWNNDRYSTYTIPKVEASELKEYKIRTSKFSDGVAEDVFKTGKTTSQVIAPVSEDSKLKDRFYVMALSDISSSTYYWDKANHEGIYGTSENFGEGKNNTEKLIYYWNSHSTENGQNADWSSSDIWNNVTKEYNDGWFVPSKGEWAAFASELKISKTSSDDKYYSNLGLRGLYWSSSQDSNSDGIHYAWSAYFASGYISDERVTNFFPVRLSTTF